MMDQQGLNDTHQTQKKGAHDVIDAKSCKSAHCVILWWNASWL